MAKPGICWYAVPDCGTLRPMKEYDLVIVGAGPAGSTLARLLGKQYRILLIDKRTFDETGRRKSCGGLVAPDAQKMLAAFGLGIPLSVLVSPQIFSVDTVDLETGDRCSYQRHYINADREALDRWLLSLIPVLHPAETDDGTGNRLAAGAFFRSSREDGRKLVVRYSNAGRETEVRTRLLVGGDGAGSVIRRGIVQDRKGQLYLSVQHWLEGVPESRAYGAFFDRRLTDFYGWSIPKGNNLIVGGAFPAGSSVAANFSRLKQALSPLGYLSGAGRILRREGALIFRPRSTADLVTGRGRVALIGEAAGFISPSSAEGLSYAFRSSLYLAEALEQGFDGWLTRYRSGCRSLEADILWKRFKAVGMSTPLVRRVALRSGIGGLKLCPRRGWSHIGEAVTIPAWGSR